MSVGAAMAVSLVGGRFFYILSGATKDDITNRAVGTEQPRRLDDPYTVFGDLEAREAQRLFAKHDYAGAKRIFATLAQRVPAPDNAPYRAYTLLADAYAKWDVFDWAAAATALKTLLDDTASLRDDLEPECARLQAQHDALQQLQNDNAQWKKKPPLTLLADLQSILPLLGSLYANAKRREAQKRYDVAALFHYRCLELISQHRLAAWGILTERPDYAAVQQHGIRARELDARYRQVEHTLFPRERGLPYAGQPISLFNGYMLLAALDDPLVHTFSIKQIRERTDARNKSMLAHGFRLITETEYQAFYGVVDELLTRFFTVSAQDRSAWEQRYQFVCPFATRPESW
jgi:CRISPR-associated protein (TIGR02710 family)